MARFLAFFTLLVLTFSPASMAAENKPSAVPCDPVAKFFGKDVCRSEVEEQAADFFEKADIPDDQKKEMTAQLKQKNRRQMFDVLWRTALAKKFGAEKLTPTEEEVGRFRDGFQAAMKSSYEADKQTIDYLEKILPEGGYDGEAAAQMKDILDTAKMGVRFYEEREKQLADLPEEYKFVAGSAESEIARNMLGRWKSDKILFDTYGGRMIFQQGGPQPVDAYKEFLKYIDKEGKFKALDPAYKDIFSEMRGYMTLDHAYLPEDVDVYKYYFSDPTWQFNLANNGKRLEDLKTWVASLQKGSPPAPPEEKKK